MKKIVFVLGILGFSFLGYGQTGGNDCSNATLLSSTMITLGIDGTNTASGIGPFTCMGGVTSWADSWYSLVANDIEMTFTYVANSATGGLLPRIQFLTGDCSSLTEIDCKLFGNFANSITINGLTVGEELILRLVDSGGNDTGTADFILTGIALPVTWTQPTSAVIKNNKTSLLFSTSQQINNSHFEIEYSLDGKQYQNIGKIEGEGDSNKEIDYEFIHNTPSFGINYYRVKQVDLDGQYSFSNVASVYYRTNSMKLYPNPVNEELIIDSPKDGTVTIYNYLGEKVAHFGLVEGQNIVNMYTQKNGIYFLRFEDGTIERVVKK